MKSLGWLTEEIFRQMGFKFCRNPDGFQKIWNLYGGKYTGQALKLISSEAPQGLPASLWAGSPKRRDVALWGIIGQWSDASPQNYFLSEKE